MTHLDLQNIGKLKVQELREYCKNYGINSSGTKPILTQRLKDYAEKSKIMEMGVENDNLELETKSTLSLDIKNVI